MSSRLRSSAPLIIMLFLLPSTAPAQWVRALAPGHHDVSPPLSTITPVLPRSAPSLFSPPEHTAEMSSPFMTATLPYLPAQLSPGTAARLRAHLNEEGLGRGFEGPDGTLYPDGELIPTFFVPSDSNGAVGTSHYVQYVNSYLAVFDKQTAQPTAEPLAFADLFQGFGHGCEAPFDHLIDGIVLFDKLASRWLIAAIRTSPPYSLCLALSLTDDATGRYYRYEYTSLLAQLGYGLRGILDYQKLAVWPDAYYLSAGPGGDYVLACALQRDAMLDGGSVVDPQCVLFESYASQPLPSDFDGTLLPPAGSPNYFVGRHGIGLDFHRFYVDFQNPSASNFNISPTRVEFDNAGAVHGIAQPGTEVMLDAFGAQMMHRVVYRNLGDHESLLANVSYKTAEGGRAAVAWFELRDLDRLRQPTPEAPTMYQGTAFAPDSEERWLGSIAMDRFGNIALGYSVSSAVTYPGIRVTGRLIDDVLGMLEQETAVQEGGGSYLDGGASGRARWGDYSSMSVDPVDDCTFWYTNQYHKTTTAEYGHWSTRIASFSFPACATPTATRTPWPTRTLVPTPTFTPCTTTCTGDCNCDGFVRIDELVRSVNIALGISPVSACYSVDRNGNGEVTVDELVAAVGNALEGCTRTQSAQGKGVQALAAAGNVSIQIGSISGVRGATGSLPITVTGGTGNAAGVNIDLLFPTNVITTPQCSVDPRLGSELDLHTNVIAAGRLRLLLADTATFPSTTFSDGVIATCSAQILSNAPLGTHALTGIRNTVSDSVGTEMPSTAVAGSVTVNSAPGGC